MKRISNKIRTVIVGVTIISLLPLRVPSVRASTVSDVLGDFEGIVTDPIKLGKASDNLLKAVQRLGPMVDELKQIPGEVNTDLIDRLNQVQTIVNKVISDVDKNVANIDDLIHDAEKKVQDLEAKIFQDAAKLIDKARCAVNIELMQMQQTVEETINNLFTADPGFSIPGVGRVLHFTGNQIAIPHTDQAYIATRDRLLKSLEIVKSTDSA